MNFDVSLLQVLTLLVNVLLPILVGLVTTRVTYASTQAILLAGLTALTGFCSEWIEAVNSVEPIQFTSVFFTWFTGFAIAVATHFGLWKPTGVTSRALDSGRHAAK